VNRILLLGASGQVGRAIRLLAPAHYSLMRPSSRDVDLRNAPELRAFVRATNADTIINCAAFTRVDDAESEHDAAFAINANAPQLLAEESARSGARLVHVSTDYVFSGQSGAPYGVDSEPSPLSVYGASKLAGERAVIRANTSACVVRTAWLHSGGGDNFVATAVRVLTSGKSMRVVDDQVSTPTRAAHLAGFMLKLLANADMHGLQHFTDAGVASWYDVAQCVAETLRTLEMIEPDVGVTPVDSSAFPRPAVRPRMSLLDKHSSWDRCGYVPLHWRDGVIASTRELVRA